MCIVFSLVLVFEEDCIIASLLFLCAVFDDVLGRVKINLIEYIGVS